MNAAGQGSEPEWNETFTFTVSDDVDDLRLKIMDKDTFGSDDFVGEATGVLLLSSLSYNSKARLSFFCQTFPLQPLFAERSLPPIPYNVVNQDKEYSGEIKV
ncbi:hypothetical protein ACFX2I_040655 [Malus domestica]